MPRAESVIGGTELDDPIRGREIHDRDTWNALVRALPHHSLHQGFEWGEVRSSHGWKPRRIAMFDTRGECVAAIGLLEKRLPILRWTILYAPAGPLLRVGGDEEAWAAVLGATRGLAEASRAVFVRVDPRGSGADEEVARPLVAGGFRALPDEWTTWNAPRIVMTLDIRETEEELKRHVRRRYREYIASSASRGLVVRPARTPEEGRVFHASLAAAGQKRGLPVRGYPYFDAVWSEYVASGRGVLLIAEHGGKAVGGLLGARLGQQATMLYVVVRDERGSERLRQGPLLYWEFIQWAKRAGCSSIDWGGVGTNFPAREEDPGFGIYNFKLGFNSKLVRLAGYFDLVLDRRRYAAVRLLERRVAAQAWTLRGRLNRAFGDASLGAAAVARKARQFQVGLRQRGLGTTLYWGAFGFLRFNRFSVMARVLDAQGPASRREVPGFRVSVVEAAEVRSRRAHVRGLPAEFYQDEIDGVELCSMAYAGERMAGVIWIYLAGDASRLFRLREDEAELNNGFVLSEFRGQGLFRALIAQACEWLADHGHRTAFAMVHADNRPSRHAFEGAGFHWVKEVRHFLFFRPKVRSHGLAIASDPAQPSHGAGLSSS